MLAIFKKLKCCHVKERLDLWDLALEGKALEMRVKLAKRANLGVR